MKREHENLLVILEENLRACFEPGVYYGTITDWFYKEVDKRSLRDGGGGITYPLNPVTRQVEIHISGPGTQLNSLQALIKEKQEEERKRRAQI